MSKEPDWTNLGAVILHADGLGPGWCVYCLSDNLKSYRVGRLDEVLPGTIPAKGVSTGIYERRVGTGLFVHEITLHIKYVVKPRRR